MTSSELINKFNQNASIAFNSDIKRVKGQIFGSSGQINCLFYIKTRASEHQNWGITANVIDSLKGQNIPWFVLLLSVSPSTGYLLTSEDTENYIKKVWRLNTDGDYKTSTSFPDDKNFKSFGQLKSKIKNSISKIEKNDLENKSKTKRQTAKIANPDLLGGDKLYLERAKTTLPFLVRQAKARQTIFYSDLAEEINIPNPRNLNYILGAIGNALIKLGKTSNIKIPQIQCLVVNKHTGLPGEGIGWFIDKNDFSKLSKSEKRQTVDRVLSNIFSFQQWDWVLQQLRLKPIKTDIKPEIEKAKQIRGSGGESPFHLAFKNFIANNPVVIGLPVTINKGQTEYVLPSADTIDIVFSDNNTKIGVEVKSKISDTADILRGLFQCVKYRYLIEAEQKVNNKQPDSKIILALEGQLPTELISVKNILGIEVKDNIKNNR